MTAKKKTKKSAKKTPKKTVKKAASKKAASKKPAGKKSAKKATTKRHAHPVFTHAVGSRIAKLEKHSKVLTKEVKTLAKDSRDHDKTLDLHQQAFKHYSERVKTLADIIRGGSPKQLGA